jgi:hypothetical protein
MYIAKNTCEICTASLANKAATTLHSFVGIDRLRRRLSLMMSMPPLRGLRFYLQPEIPLTDPFLKLSASIVYNPLTGYIELPPMGGLAKLGTRYPGVYMLLLYASGCMYSGERSGFLYVACLSEVGPYDMLPCFHLVTELLETLLESGHGAMRSSHELF